MSSDPVAKRSHFPESYLLALAVLHVPMRTASATGTSVMVAEGRLLSALYDNAISDDHDEADLGQSSLCRMIYFPSPPLIIVAWMIIRHS